MKRIMYSAMALFLIPAAAAFAISMYVGVVEGKITDEAGAPLKGAKIVLTLKPADSKEDKAPENCEEQAKKKGSQSASSGSNGQYKFVAVRPGVYNICFGLEGHQPQWKQSEIKQSVTNTFNVTLKKPAPAKDQTQTSENP